MHERVLARRYAAALFAAAQELRIVDQVDKDLEQIDGLAKSAPRLLSTLKTPTLPEAQKDRILDRALGGKAQPITINFVKLLVRKRRAALLPLIFDAFETLAHEALNEAKLTVRSATSLTPLEQAEIVSALSTRTGMTLKATFEIDPSLIGGVIARVGDTVYDGTLATELRQMAEKLTLGRR